MKHLTYNPEKLLNKNISHLSSQIVTDKIDMNVLQGEVMFIFAYVGTLWGYTNSSEAAKSEQTLIICLKSIDKYTQQKKLRKLCLRGYDKRSKTFKDF